MKWTSQRPGRAVSVRRSSKRSVHDSLIGLFSCALPQCEWRYCWLAMALPRNEQALFDNLHLENSFEDNGVSGQQVLDLLTLEDDVFQRCLSAQPAPTAQQRSNRVTSPPLPTCRHCRPVRAPLSATGGPDPQVAV